MNERHVFEVDGVTIEFCGDESLAPGVLRAFIGKTPMDAEIDALTMPGTPYWLRICVRALRWYRCRASPRLGHRCVFEPSCSRYAELAFRRRGFFTGGLLTLRRLYSCRSGSGGIDIP